MKLRAGVALAALAVACGPGAAGPPLPASVGIPPAPAPTLGFDSTRLAAVTGYLRAEVDSGAFPGAVVAVGRHGRLALLAPVGHYGVDDPRPVDAGTIYDLASLTKVVGLTTACMLLVDEGKLALDAPIVRYLPEFRGALKDRVTVRHLLTHSAGLVADLPLYDSTRTRAGALAAVDTSTLLAPPGTSYRYSDLSAIVLMQAVERQAGESFDRFLAERVFRPLGMPATRFLPPPAWRDRIAPTEHDTLFRHRWLRGEVHDESAARLGGVSGNAGLFSNALDLTRLAAMLLNGGAWDSLQLIRAETVAEFTTRQNIPPGSTRALGWDTPADSGYSSAGAELSRRSFGHTGFTGTSMWMDPDRDLFVILLTNRVHPTRANTAILRVRARVADLVAEALVHPEL
ncbi:MAG TPA: serine hydrolase domain-containing protein [Gemmatimonadales bacterium]|nr:serine hydrolase domain-containing protein [Gemmatimonadales bacterium]